MYCTLSHSLVSSGEMNSYPVSFSWANAGNAGKKLFDAIDPNRNLKNPNNCFENV
jgi:hypothetical protein